MKVLDIIFLIVVTLFITYSFLVKEKVLQVTGIKLELELQIIGEKK